ncbi:FKBP-type peptidyl-prolyl cis-trans isomerase [Parashewanella spongiae]|uniref:Peptidyl-prolyl cis-trans isomerase n=1 Tax=Parashewanella spongiae TaxID=342950 RepID=A0A3A6U9G6_9GAMM|nr:FKBP-type peptidyl-prolyl cis-trans isomerase [Parashewanella spongiae]MCL1077331.1 FKBP-type peptidyl-prolyl cis-trans isomerase [Parashewanella spongiae]RJY18582.1 FKBP-type peptidyl-prolyl cis-trans isomerase [Parashewanella spongiae]
MSDTFSTIEQRASYGIGLQMGQQLASQPFDGLDISAVQAGLAAAFNREASAVSNKDLEEAFNVINQRMQKAQEEQAEAAQAEGVNFLAENAKRDEVTVTESGLQYEVLTQGEDGDKPTVDSTVRTHYHGTFINGEVFDSSVARDQPAEFPVSGVIAGWTEALQLMTPGTKLKLFVPSQLAYGEQGAGGSIPPHCTLIFEVELLAIL